MLKKTLRKVKEYLKTKTAIGMAVFVPDRDFSPMIWTPLFRIIILLAKAVSNLI
ncbi:MAG TPA: hypothetical protein VMT81_03195 [Candidatus Paceibacterota bacterium]|nr:hypothetical protein [Candidatus Paceibacterota bacterium]